MADVAIVANDFAGVTDVLAVVTTKTSGRIEMADIVRMSRPIRFHLGEEVGPEDALSFADCCFDGVGFLCVKLVVVGAIETVETRGDGVERLLLGGVRLIQHFNSLPLEIR